MSSELLVPTTGRKGVVSVLDSRSAIEGAGSSPISATRSETRRAATLRSLGLAAAICVGIALGCRTSTPPEPASPDVPVEEQVPPIEVAEVAPPPACREVVRIEVWKQERTLKAYCKRGAVLEIDVAIGRNEVGHKLRSGDHKTPEGRYRIAAPARSGRYHLFIPIDYPSLEDAARALEAGRISSVDFDRIADAHRAGEPPPIDTGLGGDVGFHGEGERWRGDSRYHDWTYGCIALTDDDIERLSDRVTVGVPVLIHP